MTSQTTSVDTDSHSNGKEEDKDETTQQIMPALTPVTPSSQSMSQSCDNSEDTQKKVLDTYSYEYYESKENEILSCLNGELVDARRHHYGRSRGNVVEEEDPLIDLWHLRYLTLTRGGLLSPAIRKRVWPKLVGINEQVLTMRSHHIPRRNDLQHVTCSKHTVEKERHLTEEEVSMIKKDTQSCIWHVEYYMKRTRERKVGFKNLASRERDDDSSITSLDSGCSSTASGQLTPRFIPESNRCMDTPSPMRESKMNVDKSKFLMEHGPLESVSETIQEGEDSLNNPIRRVDHGRTRRREEKGLIFNIVTTVLRKKPNLSDENNLEYFNFFEGLSNIAAVLLINTESPSISSLILSELSQNHFRDALHEEPQVQQTAIRVVFMTLLKQIDPILHDQIVKGGVSDPCDFCLRWVIQWFAQDVPHLEVASRLFDVFLVSHPILPVYISVALLTYPPNRRRLMMIHCERSYLLEFLSDLPSDMVASYSDIQVLNIFEDVIQLGLSYITTFPPLQVLSMSTGYVDEHLLDVAKSSYMLQPPPSWSQVGNASTDWSLIQRRSRMKGSSPPSRSKERKGSSWMVSMKIPDQYEMALFASGLKNGAMKYHKRKRFTYLMSIMWIPLLYYFCFLDVPIWKEKVLLSVNQLLREEKRIPIPQEVHIPKHNNRYLVRTRHEVSTSDRIGDVGISDSNGSILSNMKERMGLIASEKSLSHKPPPSSKVESSFKKEILRIDVLRVLQGDLLHASVTPPIFHNPSYVWEDLMMQWYNKNDEGLQPVEMQESVDLKAEGELLQLPLQVDTRTDDHIFMLIRTKFVSFFRSLAAEVEKSPDLISEWYF